MQWLKAVIASLNTLRLLTIAQLVYINRSRMEDTFNSAIGKAIAHWQEGLPIPMTLFAELVEQGYDVPALESRYFSYD